MRSTASPFDWKSSARSASDSGLIATLGSQALEPSREHPGANSAGLGLSARYIVANGHSLHSRDRRYARDAGGPVPRYVQHGARRRVRPSQQQPRSEEHTSELQSLMRNSYAVFCLNKKM